ncbi:MAG: hypothetical protein WA719_03135 [Thermoplasmata archaeon]
MDPMALVTAATKKPNQLRTRFLTYAEELKGRNVQAAYIEKLFGTVLGWLKFNHVKVAAEDLFPSITSVRNVRRETIPTPDQLREVLAHLTSRGRVGALLMAHSGLRPGVVAHYEGNDGLTLGDLPELDIPALEFQRTPFQVVVPGRLSKNHAGYVTFGSTEEASTIVAYLRERRDKFHEKLTPNSPLVSVARQVKFTGGGRMTDRRYEPKFLTEINFASDIRVALKRVFPMDTPRPYCLRSYFSSQMFVAEGAHRITATYREAMMGHVSNMDAVYNVRKGDHLVEDMRKAYADAEEYLVTTQRTAKELEAQQLLDRIAAKLKTDSDGAKRILSDLIGGEEDERSPGRKSEKRHGGQVVRPVADLRTLVERGYRLVTVVGSEAVFETPSSASN